MESPCALMVPIPAFITATQMKEYESNPIVLCWQTIEEIRKRASADNDEVEAGQGGIVRPSVALQHSHQPSPCRRLLNLVRISQSNRSPPEDGRVDAGGSSPTPRRESEERHRGGRSHEVEQRIRGRDQEFVEHFRETGCNRWSFGSSRKIPV